jgi:hypothetical protein
MRYEETRNENSHNPKSVHNVKNENNSKPPDESPPLFETAVQPET